MTASDPKQYAELRKKVEFQVACEEKAFRIVERLIDNPVTQDFFHDSLNLITPSHYSDIVEERAVSKLCGYPLCPKILEKVFKQKYMISTKTNKIYDIEGRKNFCSGKCYKASMHVEKQIASNPLWMRKNQPPTRFSFLSLDMEKGKVGEEMFLTMADDLKKEIKTIEKMDKYHEQLEAKKANFDVLKNKPGGKNKQGNSCDQDALKDHRIGLKADSKLNKSHVGKEEVGNEDGLQREMGAGAHLDKEVGDMSRHVKEELKGDTSRKMITSDSTTEPSNLNTGILSKDGNMDGGSVKVKTSDETIEEVKVPLQFKKRKSKGGNSQTDYLMKLLDKRKTALSKMADIQPSRVASPDQSSFTSLDKSTDSRDRVNASLTGRGVSDVDEKHSEISELWDSAYKIKEISERHFPSTDTRKVDTDLLTRKECCIKQSVSDSEDILKVNDTKKHSHIPSDGKTKSAVEFMVDVVKSWLTKDSVQFLKVDAGQGIRQNKGDFEKQYQALVAKVNAQEKDFDRLIGEELMDKEEDTPKAPVPDYDHLKAEAEDDYRRVSQYLKGTFTYKIKEKIPIKDVDTRTEVVLPTVDKYNQMVIRQKIVLDRISKVLPNLLTPLNLLVQEVFTEFRELVRTFNLTSENISFKPAEWMLLTLILLKLLCCKVPTLQKSFEQSGAQTYFGVILGSLHCDWNRLEHLTASLIHV